MVDPDAITGIVSALQAAGDAERAVREKRYLRSELVHFGTSVPATRKVVKAFARRQPGLARTDVVALVEGLWAEPVHERRMAAVELLDTYRSRLEPADITLVERLIRESRTWALVDALAVRVAGGMVERCPELDATLDDWAIDDDLWLRRSALLAMLGPLRRGAGDFDRFARYAEAMLDEREFFIQKAIGWVLRDTAKRRPQLVAQWLRPRAARASAVTMREAVRYLSDEDREAVLAARAEVPPRAHGDSRAGT
jgi:3-methyladenine DNA glycosylase AlkD